MSERLEDIKEQLVMNAKLKIEDVNWLIEQAELLEAYKKDSLDLQEINEQNFKRIEELERKIKGLEQAYDEVDDKNLGLEEENKRYREALEFYANKDNYKLEHFDPNLNDYMSTVDYDEGQKARQAIGGEQRND